MLISLYNEWLCQCHELLKVVFLNLCSSWDAWRCARNDCGSCCCFVLTAVPVSSGTLWVGGWAHRAWMWETYLLIPAQMLTCFLTAQVIFPSVLHIEIARHRTAQIQGMLRWLCRSELCGLALLLRIWVVTGATAFQDPALLPSTLCAYGCGR